MWASAAETSSWASPTAKAIKKVSALPAAQHESTFLDNVDCELLTYRLVDSSQMRSGCFTPTAYGMMDIDTGVVIFNGTDEGLPLLPYNSRHALVPWPKASSLIVLDAVSTGGSYLNLYTSPLAALQDQRNAFGQLTAKKLTTPPDMQVKDASGQRLIINPQTISISDGGSWLIAEALNGSFVRINLATLDFKVLAQAYPQNNPGLLNSRVTVSDDGRYVAIHNQNFNELKVYDLSNCLGNVCSSHNYQSFINANIQNVSLIRHLRFVNKDLLSFEATSSVSGQSGVYQLAPRSAITSMTDYIGLGDSYTSGEGAFDYLDGTDTGDNVCHISTHSYPLLLKRDLFSEIGGHSVACSGAKIHDVGSVSDTYRGQMRGVPNMTQLRKEQPTLLESIETNFLPGYVAQHRFVQRWQPQVISVSIGGNDVGFGDILQECVMPRVSKHHSDNTCFNTYEDRLELKNLIKRTIPRWTTLFKQLRAESQVSQIYVIGYPDVIDDTGACALNVNLGKTELVFAKELLAQLNESIEEAATNASVSYVDISDALVGHRLCETKSHNVAVNGLTSGRDLFVFGRESYHPNALGHQLIKQAILRKTDNLRLRPTTTSDKPPSKLLDAPSSGRSILSRQPTTFTNNVQRPGSTMAMQLTGGLLKPAVSYSVRLDGANGRIIGTLIGDSDGNGASGIILPPDIPPGPHTVDVVGQGPTDEIIDITQPIYIPESDDDTDGDGISNPVDSCPAIVNSGQDVDQDGTDDVCDPLISTAPSPPVDTSPSSSNDDPAGESGSGTELISSPEGMPLEQPTLTVASFISTSTNTISPSTKANRIYHRQGVGVNNLASSISIQSDGKSAIKRAKRVEHVNPWILWWIYLLFIPILLWVLLEGCRWILGVKLRVPSRVFGRLFNTS